MNKTLLILAAGMGSRFGGLKQLEPFGPNKEFIIDYSVYDAIRTGFNKIVFIIKEENYNIFRETIGKRIEDKIKVEYVFQKLDNLPKGYNVPDNRVKPWGTAHAILSAKNVINEPFAIINSDDFYGYDAFKTVSEFLDKMNKTDKEHFGLVGYKVINTLTENGSVKRGVCEIKEEKLVNIIECSIEKKDSDIIASPLNGEKEFIINDDTRVCMNMLAFSPSIFNYIESNFEQFLINNKNDLEKCEYLIPDVLKKGIEENYCDVKVLNTTSKWAGVTYKEDKENVVNYINELINKKEYKANLWE